MVFPKKLIALFFVMITFNGCSDDVHNHPQLTTGEELFEYHCSGCHKQSGKGNFLKGVPANRDTILSTLQITHKIKSGSEGGSKMPSFQTMSEKEAQKIATYLKNI